MMPTWDQFTAFVSNQGLAVALVAFFLFGCVSIAVAVTYALRQVWLWWKPQQEQKTAKQCAMYDSICNAVQRQPVEHKRLMRGFGHIGSMHLAKDQNERRIHFEQLEKEIDDADGERP